MKRIFYSQADREGGGGSASALTASKCENFDPFYLTVKGLKNAFFMPFSWLQMMIRRGRPPANYHPEEKLGLLGLRSSKSTFGGNNYIDFFVRLIFRDWVLLFSEIGSVWSTI